MSLNGTQGEAAEQIAMPDGLTAEIPAIRAKVGVAAKGSRPVAPATCSSNASWVSVVASLVTSGPLHAVSTWAMGEPYRGWNAWRELQV